MASLTQWTWVWEDSGSWWWTGRPGVLRFMGSQRVGHDWATELNFILHRQLCWFGVYWVLGSNLMVLLLPSRLSRVRLCATPWTAASQASPSMGFSRQEHWSGLPFPSPISNLIESAEIREHNCLGHWYMPGAQGRAPHRLVEWMPYCEGRELWSGDPGCSRLRCPAAWHCLLLRLILLSLLHNIRGFAGLGHGCRLTPRLQNL